MTDATFHINNEEPSKDYTRFDHFIDSLVCQIGHLYMLNEKDHAKCEQVFRKVFSDLEDL